MRQKYNFCSVWSRRHWKSIAKRSSFFMCICKCGGEIIIRWTKVVTEVLLESGQCCWSSTMLEGWIWYTTTKRVIITRIRDNFEVDGTVQDVLKGRWGSKRSCTDKESAAVVMQVFARSPKKSLKQCSHEIGIEKSSVNRILRTKKWKPYISLATIRTVCRSPRSSFWKCTMAESGHIEHVRA